MPAEVTRGEYGRSNLKGKNGSIELRETFELFRTGTAIPNGGPGRCSNSDSLDKDVQPMIS